jgi:hypothetical protein
MVQIFGNYAMIKFNACKYCILVLGFLILTNQGQTKAQKLTGYKEEIYLEKNGEAKVICYFKFEKDSIEEIRLPWNFSAEGVDKITFKLCGNKSPYPETEALSPKVVVNEGVFFIQLKFTRFHHNTDYCLEYRLPALFNFNKEKIADFGNYTFKYRFINTMLPEINNFSSEIVLPYGYLVTSIDETIPKQTEDNPVSPFQVTNKGKNSSVIIKAAKLKLGEQSYVKMQIKSDKKSLFLFIIVIVVGILYLYFFRDLVSPKVKPDENGK